ncbi:MAG: hypothetical protein FGM24_04585 [Candidatus Kapabacteria bacterium]|nr:hypothetical protein [Candidatus Kapabacteria bacterium]
MRCIVMLALAVFPSLLVAQQQPTHDIGILLEGRMNVHDASFRQMPSVPCCSPGFTGAVTSGVAAGLVYSTTLPDLTGFTISARAMMATLDATMTTDEARTVHLYGQAVPGLFRHTLQSSVTAVGLDVLLGYHPVERLTIAAGPTFMVPVASTYEQTETIVEPTIGGFDITGQQRSRVLGSGALPDVATVTLGATLRVAYDLPLDARRRIVLSPEVLATAGITNLVAMADASSHWRLHALRAGMTLTYGLQSGDASSEVEAPPDEPLDFEGIRGSIIAGAVRPDGTEAPVSSIVVEQSVVTRSKPLLPSIFFDEQRATIPARYVLRTSATAADFDERRLHDVGMLDAYHEILNVIGRRMQARPRSVLTVTGLTHDLGSERERRDISAGRAYAVKDYLVTTWNINAARIKAGFRDVQLDPARTDDDRYMQEMRRVEVSSEDAEILADVWTSDTSWIAQPAVLRLTPYALSNEDIERWRVVVSQDTLDLAAWVGEDGPPPVINWDIITAQPGTRLRSGTLTYALTAVDDDDSTLDVTGTPIRIDVRTMADKRAAGQGDIRIDRHTFIGFDIADATPTAQHQRVADRIKASLGQARDVRIDAYTDAMGEAAFNVNLSARRATAIGALLRGDARVTGHGSAVQRYDELLPEGRQYARSVEVEIEYSR